MHMTFRPRMVAYNNLPHSMVHSINKETPLSIAASIAKPQVLTYKIRAQLPIGYMAYS